MTFLKGDKLFGAFCKHLHESLTPLNALTSYGLFYYELYSLSKKIKRLINFDSGFKNICL